MTLTCETCGDASTSVESFRHLSLEIPPSETFESAPLELQGLIARCFASETVERRCARAGCGGTRAAMARRLLRAPRALLVHLKRFRAEDASRETCGDASFCRPSRETRNVGTRRTRSRPPRLTKDARPITLPETVTLAPFADAAVRGPPTASAETGGGDGPSAFSRTPISRRTRRRRRRARTPPTTPRRARRRARSSRRIGSRGWSRTWGHPCAGATASRARAWTRAEKTKTVLRRRRSDGCLSTTSARVSRGRRRRPRPRLATGTSPRSSAKPRGDANETRAIRRRRVADGSRKKKKSALRLNARAFRRRRAARTGV